MSEADPRVVADPGGLRPRAGGAAALRLVVVGMALALAALILVTYSAALTGLRAGWPEHPRVVVAVAQVMGLLLPAVGLIALLQRGGLTLRPPGLAAPFTTGRGAALVGLALTGHVVAQASYLAWLGGLHATGWEWVPRAEAAVREALAPILEVRGPADAWALVVVVGLVPAVCEEVVFRRGIQALLSAVLPGWLAIGGAATIFSAFHLDVLGFPSRFFLGVSIGYAYHRTGSLAVAAFLHAANNLLAVGLVLALGAEAADQALTPHPTTLQVLLAMPILVIALVAWGACALALPPRRLSADGPS